MKKRQLNYRFHNPNSAEETADFLCKLLIEANTEKVEKAITKATQEKEIDSECKTLSDELAVYK